MAESPTDGADTSSSDSDESVLDTSQQNQSADEQQDTTSSGETHDVDQQSDNEPQHETTQEDDSSDDDGLSNFAKAQGFDSENLTDNERKALKLAHDNQKAFRKTQQQKTDESRKALNDVNSLDESETEELDPYDAKIAEIESKQARIESTQRLQDFYLDNPEAREYDTDMAKIVNDEAERNGKAAARYLASDFKRLLTLAKAEKSSNEAENARKQGRQEERDLIRKRQEASADTAHATNSHQETKKVTEDWIDKEYDPSKPEHRQMVDEAMARGDLY